jgi:hypothetical protein
MVNKSAAEDSVYVSCSVYNAHLPLGLAIQSARDNWAGLSAIISPVL